jgi:DNA-binding XRE family transcriptional regulator
MSAFPRPDDVRQAIRAGARDLIEKPIKQPALFRALDRQLSEIGIAARTEQLFNVRLGARLRELREAAQRAQQDVAHDVGISPAQLSQIERGKTATTTWTLARIAGVLKIPLDSVLRDL